MVQSMRDLERTFNRKFNYPWLFLNDVPFTEEFKKKISAETKAKVTFGEAHPHKLGELTRQTSCPKNTGRCPTGSTKTCTANPSP